RTYHKAEYHPATPVLKPDQKWEQTKDPCAMVFSDGVWYEPADKLFKMWYMGGITRSTCYAVSQDGIRWEKPKLDVVKDTNIVHPGFRDSTTVWLDHEEKDSKRRFKLFRSIRHQKSWALSLHFSPDGIHWTEPGIISGPAGDRTTAYYNPFRKVWVYSLRSAPLTRSREYREHADVVEGSKWQEREPIPWVGADKLDPARQDLKTQPQLYNLDCVAYESILLGLFSIWRGQPTDRAKPNEIVLGYSRDGFHWHRPERQAFIPVSEKYGDWNWGNVQSAGGCCLVVGEKLYFYVSGRAGVRGSPASGVCTTGLAVLRRDGFASMDADKKEGTVTTRRVTFQGKHLFVNANATGGELRAEILDGQGKIIPPFTAEKCDPVRANETAQHVRWRGVENLGTLAGRPVQIRFYLKNGRLYSFWISPEESGASHGYVAAGGPGFAGPVDDGRS
ncbi:MAG TPA: hypothetical protein VKS79_11410, partial [Gemmataceae bacterium]|nr:hypothetical protein [Gemmataceae bacterium]